MQSVVQFAAPAAAGAILTISTLRATLMLDIITAIVGIGLLALILLALSFANEKPKEEITGNGIACDK